MQEHSGNILSKLLVKWKLYFMIVTIAAIGISVFLSEWLIQPKYSSFAIVYPSNIISYGSENQLHQMVQVLESADVKNTVIEKMNLATHYAIDTFQKKGTDKLIDHYESNVNIVPTCLGSVKIKVLDTDPKAACEMVNAIIDAFNLKMQTLYRNQVKEQATTIKNELLIIKHRVDSLDTRLEELRVKYQIFDYEMQSEEVTKAYLNAVSTGRTAASLKDIDVMMRNLEEKGGEFNVLKKMFDAELKSYAEAQSRHDNEIKELKKEITYMAVITSPVPAHKRTYTICWSIILASVIFANLFLFLIILLFDRRRIKLVIPES